MEPTRYNAHRLFTAYGSKKTVIVLNLVETGFQALIYVAQRLAIALNRSIEVTLFFIVYSNPYRLISCHSD